jgi:orotate phosphoribosyltransferase
LLVSHHSGCIERLREIIRSTGTLLSGHFALDAERHSPYFIRFSQIGWNQRLTDEVAEMLLAVAPFASQPATLVCAETSAIFLARALGRRTGNPVAVAAVDRRRHPTAVLRTGEIAADRPVLVVSDVITTGRSLAPLIGLGGPGGAIGIAAFAALSTARFEDFARSRGLEAEWLMASTWQTARPDAAECTGCRDDTPLFLASEFS